MWSTPKSPARKQYSLLAVDQNTSLDACVVADGGPYKLADYARGLRYAVGAFDGHKWAAYRRRTTLVTRGSTPTP